MIAIIDSGGANIASVQFALERRGAKGVLTADTEVINAADKVILPGVGAADVAMRQLREKGLIDCIRALKQPVLGVCLGMQLLFEHSDEEDTELLGVVPGKVAAFPAGMGLTVPHMGWNRLLPIDKTNSHPLLHNVAPGSHVYFVHSYFAPLSGDTIAGCDYGLGFTAMVASGNFMGCQFHPEKSGPVGAQILNNFLLL
ncbi:imidazole glycerol phosphate synthase subunit HisH [Alphaproteobacteria bacterium]|nr:imidazole glycerol phosphate synthase subunit HisH [Alphaproteobacteria bacterium]